MNYQHRFTVAAPLQQVVNFHLQSANMAAITPPPLRVHMHHTPPARLSAGDEVDFSLRLGPLAIPWLVRIDQVSVDGFVDRQVRGPFHAWVHRRRFEALDANRTAVHDQVEAVLHRHPLRRIVGLLMWLNLPVLFAYRAWKTRRLLESAPASRSLADSEDPRS